MIAKHSIIGTKQIIFLSFFPRSDMNELRRAASSEDFKFLIADYDRVWGLRGVTRTRDIIEKMQHLGR